MYGLDAVASIQKRKETSIIGLTHENTTPINTTVIAVEPFTRLEVHGAFPHLGSVPCRMARSYLASFGFVENGHGMRYSVPMHDTAETILKELLDAAGVAHSGVVRSELAGQILYSIQAADPRSLIGVRGDTVHALDHLVKKILEGKLPAPPPAAEEGNAPREEVRFLVDVNDYRGKQIKDLQTKALMMAEGAPSVKTESQGEGRSRRVVIKYSAG